MILIKKNVLRNESNQRKPSLEECTKEQVQPESSLLYHGVDVNYTSALDHKSSCKQAENSKVQKQLENQATTYYVPSSKNS